MRISFISSSRAQELIRGARARFARCNQLSAATCSTTRVAVAINKKRWPADIFASSRQGAADMIMMITRARATRWRQVTTHKQQQIVLAISWMPCTSCNNNSNTLGGNATDLPFLCFFRNTHTHTYIHSGWRHHNHSGGKKNTRLNGRKSKISLVLEC